MSLDIQETRAMKQQIALQELLHEAIRWVPGDLSWRTVP